MTKKTILEVEILGGPLDGHVAILESETEWTQLPGSLLSFPWDLSLGEPQAHFSVSDGKWQIIHANAKRGTHLLRSSSEEHLPAILQTGDILKASNTWLKVKALRE